MQKRRNIILTGYRATGKSTVGKELADRLGYTFLDMDAVIEERQGCSIREMVAAQGWPFFRGLERELLRELLAREGLVIATGGGAILHQELWPELMATGLVVWLAAAPQTICRRLAADRKTGDQRPSLTGQEIGAEVESVLAAREPLYRQGAHLCIDTDRSAPAEIVERIIRALPAGQADIQHQEP